MKTTPCLIAGLALALFVSRLFAGTDVVADWNVELDAVQRSSQQLPSGRIRADAIMKAILVSVQTGLEADGHPAEPPPAGANLEAAAAHAAYAAMSVLYSSEKSALDARLAESLAAIDDTPAAITAGKDWGQHVAQIILAEQGDAVTLNAYSFAAVDQSPAGSTPGRTQADSIGPGDYRSTILAGVQGVGGSSDGVGAVARFDAPRGIAVDAAGNVYVSEFELCTIRKITPAGVVTTIAGAVGQQGSQDGAGTAARFNHPSGLAVDATGNVYVTDSGNLTVRKIDPAGMVTTVAGLAGQKGQVDGPKNSALFELPSYVTVDDAGNLFVSDNLNIRKVAPDGRVSTLQLDMPFRYYFSSAPAYWMEALSVDHTGNVYVIVNDGISFGADVVKLTPGSAGHFVGKFLLPADLRSSPAPFNLVYGWATGLGFDGVGNLLITQWGSPVLVLTPAGEFQARYIDGGSYPVNGGNVAVGASGNLYTLPVVSDWGDSDRTVRIVTFDANPVGPVIRSDPSSSSLFVGDGITLSVSAVGGPTLSYQWYFHSTPVKGANQAELNLRVVQPSDAGDYYVVVTDSNGSATSRTAMITVVEDRVQTTTSTSTGSTSAAGGGNFEQWSSLPVLILLGAAAFRRRAGMGVKLTPDHRGGAFAELLTGRESLITNVDEREDSDHV